jgi:predicted nuclease of restriction endonuclease-like (RecB) superfamily/predicted nucleotidyltransferase
MHKPPLIDVRPDLWEIVRGILQTHVPQYEVWAFGSRAKGTAKPYSDLDLAVITSQPLTLDVSAALSDAFAESDLPWRVDVVDWATTSESFRKIIEREKVVVQPAGKDKWGGWGMGSELLPQQPEYRSWLGELKTRFRQVQLKAAVAVNTALLQFYWELGADMVARQQQYAWGQGFVAQLSADLMREFPEVKGFSERNLKYIRQWHLFWREAAIGQQPVAQLSAIPWGHNLAILTKCKQHEEALYYVQNTIAYGWSRSVLVHQIESGLWQREGQAMTNFAQTLPAVQSELAAQVLKDPYVFDFLSLTKEHSERELETGLVQHITQFLLELGAGFAFMGRQVPLQVGERDFFLDLLFYHARLHCYVVVELKTVDFEPEFAGKLNFYLKAVDEQLRREGDQPTIGLLLCKSKDRLVAEYALSDIQKPMGLSTYNLSHTLPEALRGQLPSIEQLERELGLQTNDGDAAKNGGLGYEF